MAENCKRIPTPQSVVDEVMRLREEFYKRNPEPDVDALTDEEAEAILGEIYDRCDQYIDAHLSPIAREYMEYRSRCGDENELRSSDGSRLRTPEGNLIQDWYIDEQKRIVDEHGSQIYDNDGSPILAKKMSCEFAAFLQREKWWDDCEPTEEDLWY